MPTDDDLDTIEGVDDASENPSPAKPQSFNFKLDTADLSRQISSGVRAGFQEMLASARPAQRDPDEEEVAISEDDDQATVTRKAIHNAMIPMRQEMKQFRNFGLDKLGNITHQLTVTSLPYYNDYKTEIDAGIAQLPPDARADANTIRIVYNNVVASHTADIQAKAVDEYKRQQQLENEPPAPGGSNTRVAGRTGGNKVPTPSELGFDDEQLNEIELRGGPDRFARAVSGGRYADWNAYAAGYAKMSLVPKQTRGRVIPFARLGRDGKRTA